MCNLRNSPDFCNHTDIELIERGIAVNFPRWMIYYKLLSAIIVTSHQLVFWGEKVRGEVSRYHLPALSPGFLG